MGIAFSHCNASWAYSGFMEFRKRLAGEIGISLDVMEGFNGSRHAYPWSMVKDPIVPLLNHSDCDGELSPAECLSIAPRLRELVADWDDGDYDKRMALELAKGMESAAQKNEPLNFG